VNHSIVIQCLSEHHADMDKLRFKVAQNRRRAQNCETVSSKRINSELDELGIGEHR